MKRIGAETGMPASLKMQAKRWLSRLVWASGYRRRHGLRCLCYHSIVPDQQHDAQQMTTPVSLFRRQMQCLADGGYRVEDAATAVRQLAAGTLPDPKTVVLTFDDGFADNYRLAFPVLRDYRFPATIFLISSALKGEYAQLRNRWEGEYLAWGQVHEMQASGLIQFGCHSATHRNLRGLSADILREEIVGAKRDLEGGLGRSVELFAYPFGSFGSWDTTSRSAVEDAGFLGAFTAVAGFNTISEDRFLLRRTRVSWVDEVHEFARLLQGAYDWYALIQRLQASRTRAAGTEPLTAGPAFI